MMSEAASMNAIPSRGHGQSETVANQALGFWFYLMSDLVLFAALFATFAVLSGHYAGGPTGKDLFHLPYTLVETMLLLLGSATYGLVMLAMHAEKKGVLLVWLAVTFLFGLGFLGMEINEFHGMIQDGSGPGRSAFLSAFFTLVGTHGLHVTAGMIWMVVMAVQVLVKGLTLQVQSRLLRLSMFWHFLDIVWVAVFSVVYLKGVL